jgi:ribbon-helix-helix CopG family protein
MRRTQLYLDEPLWNALHSRARSERTTISELVRQAVRDRYLGDLEERRKAMKRFVGIRKESSKSLGSAAYVRQLRRGSRMDRLTNQ